MIGDYLTQLDEIDQWLNDNFGILPGACSSTENLRYSVARRVAEALWPKTQSLLSDVDEAAKAYEDKLGYYECMNQWPSVAFKAGANWQKEQTMKGNPVVIPVESFQAIIDENYNNGKQDMRKKMLEDAVEGTYAVTTVGHFAFFTDKPIKDLCFGDKVKIIIVPIKED